MDVKSAKKTSNMKDGKPCVTPGPDGEPLDIFCFICDERKESEGEVFQFFCQELRDAIRPRDKAKSTKVAQRGRKPTLHANNQFSEGFKRLRINKESE